MSAERPSSPPPAGGPPEKARAAFQIKNVRGLHARAATKLVQLASRFPCEVLISGPDAEDVNAKSVMGVLLLCGAVGTTIEVKAVGPGAPDVVSAIGKLIDDKFGEAE